MDLGVALLGGEAAGEGDHLGGQVDPERRGGAGGAGRVAGGLAGAASDVENSLTWGDGRCGHEPVLVGGDRPVEVLGVGRPVGALATVPRAGLISVGGVGGYGPALSSTPLGRRPGHATAARNSSTASGSARRAEVRTGSANPEGKALATIWLDPAAVIILITCGGGGWSRALEKEVTDPANSHMAGPVLASSVSKLYEEPKKLVDHGFARSSTEQNGQRSRTVYTITAKGRRALADWLHDPGEGPTIEFRAVAQGVLRRARHQGRRPGHAARNGGVGAGSLR